MPPFPPAGIRADHVLMAWTEAKRRYGFPRWGSQVFLTDSITSEVHRYAHWQAFAYPPE
jgi:hypothetical protein